ncbi:hypothetical protein SDC9_176058 [bioreactor metagenome]|uniref:Uncharacterized protein n=1 Tax=bioreactor metagenome TaxID=1076179 RepID=A0A645GPH5_9ZZZZ
MKNIKVFSFPQDFLLIIVCILVLFLVYLNVNLGLSIFISLLAITIFILWVVLRLSQYHNIQQAIKIIKLLEIQVLESTEIIQQIHVYLNNDLRICISNIIINNEWFNDILILRTYLTELELRQVIDLMYHFDSLQKNYNYWTESGDKNLQSILKTNISPGNSDLIDEVNAVRTMIIKLKSDFSIN